MIIKWRNVLSGEEGYVAKISAKERCFHNTFNKADAAVYKTKASAKRILNMLEEFGQGMAINNEFSIITA